MSTKKTPAAKTTSKQGTMAPAKAKDIRDNVAQAGTALAPRPVDALSLTYEKAVDGAKQHIAQGMQMLTAAVAMKDLTDLQMATLKDYAASTEEAVSEAKNLIRGRLLDAALTRGTVTTEKGSRRLDLGNGMYVPITAQKTGTDPNKFEAALLAKGASRAKYMDSTVVYSMKKDGASVDAALADGLFTQDEVKALAYEKPQYRVERVKTAKDGE